MQRILVIKLGALGDFVLAFGAFAAIRAAHPGALITLLTTEPFVPLAERAPWFDRIAVDSRAPWWNLIAAWRMARRLHGFDFVYDLQTSARSGHYFRLAGHPKWSGIVRGASHPHANPDRNRMHTFERQREQLAMAGIRDFPRPDLAWLTVGMDRFAIEAPYTLLVPGAAPHRPAKRWPADRFAELARHLTREGLRPVLLGAGMEQPLGAAIRARVPEAIDLIGETALLDLGPLAAGAALAVGNDTGPMHFAAAMGCPSLVLFSAESDPALTAPRGPGGEEVGVLAVRNLADLSVARVVAALPSPHRRLAEQESRLACPSSAFPMDPPAASSTS